MLILALDTSATFVSVSLLNEKQVFAFAEKEMERGQAEALMPMISDVLARARMKMSDLNAIAVTVGPGSFTGVRIGLAAARGFGLALNIPVYGVTCFEAWAYHLGRPCTVVLDSKRGDYFVQSFDADNKSMGAPLIQSAEDLKRKLPFSAVGTAAVSLSEEIGCEVLYKISPISVTVGRIALSRLDNPLLPNPLYMRDADVTL